MGVLLLYWSMRNLKNHEIGIGFVASAKESEYKAAEQMLAKHFGSKLDKCVREGYSVIAQVRDLSSKDRASFCNLLSTNDKRKALGMPNIQIVGPNA